MKKWRDTVRTLPAQAVAVVRSPLWQRRLGWAVGALLVLWALAYAAVPALVKWQVQSTVSTKLGRQVTVGAVDFKPWSLEMTVHDLAVARAGATGDSQPAPQASPQFKVKRIYIDAELQSLLRLAPVADAIVVEAPVLSVAHLGDGRYDIDDILDRLKTPDEEPAGSQPRFALYNLMLTDGQIDFNDQPAGKAHALRDLDFSVPFLSNLRSKRDVTTAPRLAFKLNGSSFDTAAVGTPFAQTRKTDATLAVRDLDLRPYLAYWPASLPFRLQNAVMHADVKVAFEQTPATSVRISGTVTADKVRLRDAQGAGRELLDFERLQVSMDDVRPLEQLVKLSAVELTAPTLHITRDRAGRLNLLPAAGQSATKNGAASVRPQRAAGQKGLKDQANAATAAASAPRPPQPATAAASTPWKIQVARAAVRAGSVNWRDEALASPADIRLSGLVLDASAMALPFSASAPLKFTGSAGLALPPAAQASPARLSFSGSATDRAAQVSASVADWPLAMAAKYVGEFLLPALQGRLDAQLAVDWRAAAGAAPQALQVTAPQISVSDVSLAQGNNALVSIQRVNLAQVAIDVQAQSFKAASLQLSQPKARVERGADQRWMYERWLVQRKAASTPPPAAARGSAAPSWAVAINDVQLEGGAVSFSDKAGAAPVAFEVTAAQAQLGAVVLDDRSAGKSRASQWMPLTASLRLGTGGRRPPGKIDFKGRLGLDPRQAEGQLAVDDLPLQVFEPYFGDALNIDLRRADASFKGQVAYRQTAAGPVAQVGGDFALEDFRANTLAPSEELLAWKALNLRGLQVALEPAKATRVDIKNTVVTDFFARVIVMPDGRINLQDLMKPSGQRTPAPDAAPETIAAGARPISAGGQNDAKNRREAAAAEARLPAIVNVGPLQLVNGKVLFSDRFVKPNYSANLSELNGTLGAFSSVPPSGAVPAMADLTLRGRAEGTASLEILGKLNPLAQPLALDIQGKVRDLELPPLSPYSIKYAGYGINRGKLSVDVGYVVQPNGQLTASNKIVLNQLSFGDKAEGSTASLPVKLAVALLADRNGVIDIDLPVSGSLNDPQFSLGSVIFKAIGNLIVKAVTAPFSLLANAFGGGSEELGTVPFPAGSARLAPDARGGLDKVAKVLQERSGLRLTVVGTSSLAAEAEGYRREQLDEMVRAQKRRVVAREGGDTAAVSVSPAEYPALLSAVYRRTDMAKPRNLVGLAKDLPVPEMEKLLMAGIAASEDAMRELALQRGVAVKDYLASRGLPMERLFLGATKAAAPDANWTPRAELNLAMP